MTNDGSQEALMWSLFVNFLAGTVLLAIVALHVFLGLHFYRHRGLDIYVGLWICIFAVSLLAVAVVALWLRLVSDGATYVLWWALSAMLISFIGFISNLKLPDSALGTRNAAELKRRARMARNRFELWFFVLRRAVLVWLPLAFLALCAVLSAYLFVQQQADTLVWILSVVLLSYHLASLGLLRALPQLSWLHQVRS
jgi:hypothetical protein